MSKATSHPTPTHSVSVRNTFGMDTNMQVLAFSEPNEYVPAIDQRYHFNPQATLAVLLGFSYNRRVILQGLHGTGKSTHIEQVAARLNWPCLRVNLDGHISRLDLVGKDSIVLREGKQVTEFEEGILPWAIQQPMALIFDEYDAGRPEVMFVIQRLLERDGNFTLLEQKRVLQANPFFRLFATMNTLGQGNFQGLYHGTQLLNQAQLDRWNLVTSLDYLDPTAEVTIVLAHAPELDTEAGHQQVQSMVALAQLTRNGFAVGDLSVLMSPRTVIMWAENTALLHHIDWALHLTFINKCEPSERGIVSEYFQRCFNRELKSMDNNNMLGDKV